MLFISTYRSATPPPVSGKGKVQPGWQCSPLIKTRSSSHLTYTTELLRFLKMMDALNPTSWSGKRLPCSESPDKKKGRNLTCQSLWDFNKEDILSLGSFPLVARAYHLTTHFQLRQRIIPGFTDLDRTLTSLP